MPTDLMKKPAAILSLWVTILFSGGCSTVMTKPFPDLESSLTIGVTDKDKRDSNDWAPGVYPLADTNICFARGQGLNDVSNAAGMFGLLGAAISVGESSGKLKKMIEGQEAVFSLDLRAITRQYLKKGLERSKGASRFSASNDWKTAHLQVTPYSVFSFIGEDKARLWVVLRVEWIDQPSTFRKWKCRYLVGLGDPKPLTGELGWSSNKGKLLETTVKNGTELALRVMLEDLQGKLRPDKAPKEYFRANWMFYKNPLYAEARVLKIDEDWDILLPLVEDDEYFAGVNVVPKDFDVPEPVSDDD
jgi:hypothetical protein